jgi:Dolichyl-phosphate-mannose-protein mannosyltransferase
LDSSFSHLVQAIIELVLDIRSTINHIDNDIILKVSYYTMPKNLLRFTFGLMVFQIIFWTMVPVFSHHAPPLDATEMYGWSLSFQWGFYKHPPMPAWIVSLVQLVVGKNMLSLFLCASMAISATYYCVAWLANRFLSEKEAIVALFLYALTIYCHLWSTDFNHNQIQMPFWALSLVFLVLSLDTGQKKWAIALGLCMGLNALSKYTAAFILPCALGLIFYSQYWRRNLSGLQMILASGAFLLVFLPHLYWLTQHQFMPFHYVNERFDEMKDNSNLLNMLDFLGNILLAHLILLIATGTVIRKKVFDNNLSHEDRLFIWVMGLGPIALTLLIGLFVPLYHRWATPMLPMVTIVVAMILKGRFSYLCTRRYLIIFVILQLLFGFIYIYKDRINPNQSSRGNYPAPEIAAQIYKKWQVAYPNHPFRIVSGGEWEAGYVSLFSPDKTYVYTQADSTIAPWVSEKDVEACGMVMLMPNAQELERFSHAKLQEPIRVKNKQGSSETVIEFALVPPKGECKLK